MIKFPGKCRALVRAGATGARAPAEIWQRVQGTRPDKAAIIVNSKKSTPKLKVNHLSKIKQYRIVVFEGRDSKIDSQSLVKENCAPVL